MSGCEQHDYVRAVGASVDAGGVRGAAGGPEGHRHLRASAAVAGGAGAVSGFASV